MAYKSPRKEITLPSVRRPSSLQEDINRLTGGKADSSLIQRLKKEAADRGLNDQETIDFIKRGLQAEKTAPKKTALR